MVNCNLKPVFYLLLLLLLLSNTSFSQGYLHRQGKYIYDGSGNEVILRGIGTGNWMLQEGYMMQTAGVAGTQHEFREELIKTIGVEKTDSFYTAWLNSHFRRIDVDSMKSWGFNSVRVAMHYKWFTPPLEEETVTGEVTWLETGFTLIDSLLDWCSNNEMYLILDMHGTPGGQGKNADISDYDPLKPSLWESQDNKNKLIELWKKLAQRYSEETWIGGYDLINETNWPLANNNKALWDLHKEITYAIREVDNNHLIFIEGNGFANDFNGLPAIWDDNLALSFHKYGTLNNIESINWMINLRNTRNVPIWLGETGENSNNWFTSLVTLCEDNQIGWSLWPVKKPSINNVLSVKVNEDYTRLIDYWKGDATNPGVEAAFNAVLQFAENHRLENCIYQKNVVDAIFRQPYTTETKPFKLHTTEKPVFAVDYDMGRNGYVYFDNDTANLEYSLGEYTNWNQGWIYRNDGVDIETCNDADTTNGYSVGWTGDNEWLEYTIVVDSTAGYNFEVRSASGSGGSKIHLEYDGRIITPLINLPNTSGWYNWKTTSKAGVILEKGVHKVRFVFDQGGSNLNYFQFLNQESAENVPFKLLSAESSEDGKSILLSLNKAVNSDISTTNNSDFRVAINSAKVDVASIEIDNNDSNKVIIHLDEPLYYDGTIKMTYRGDSLLHNDQKLEYFANFGVINNLPVRFEVPTRIQSEDYYYNFGMMRESCDDIDGGYNMGYAAPGDYMDYFIYVPESGNYDFNYRVATERSNSQVIILIGEGSSFAPVDTVTITGTGGWQIWKTISSTAFLPEGRYTLRVYVRSNEFNINWFEVKNGRPVGITQQQINLLKIYPNPASDLVNILLPETGTENSVIKIFSSGGEMVKLIHTSSTKLLHINTSGLAKGIYQVIVEKNSELILSNKLIIN